MRTKKSELEYYMRHCKIVCDNLGITINQYNKIRAIGNRLHRIYEWQCNGQDSQGRQGEAWEARWERWENNYMFEVTQWATKKGLHVYFQTDPRGATIYMDKNPIPENNYSQSPCIY